MTDIGQHNPGQISAVPLFATPFASVTTGADRDLNARVASLCDTERTSPSDDASRDPLHFRGSPDFLDSTDATASELRRLILHQASVVVAGLSERSTADFGRLRIQARGWCSVVQRHGHISCQNFTGASWLAVYCAQAGEPDEASGSAGVLRLYERRLGSIYRDASNSDLASPYRYGNHTWTPVPGSMAIFPAHVPHEVSVVRSGTSLILVFALIRFLENG
jgi:hypothetical protein